MKITINSVPKGEKLVFESKRLSRIVDRMTELDIKIIREDLRCLYTKFIDESITSIENRLGPDK